MLIVVSLITLKASGQELGDVYELTLEELMDVTITSASKKEEKEFSAPSVINTITRDEIERFGGQDLYEILERATSFYGIYSFVFPKNVIGLRGNLPTHINPNMLFLINGRPFRESVKGGQNVGLLATMPASFIERIEIIRGPGSVLYGSNAFIGVINVITKEQVYDNEMSVNLSGGSLSTVTADLRGNRQIEDWCFSYGVSFLSSDGWEFGDSTRLRNVPVDNPTQVERQYANFNFGQERFSSTFDVTYHNFSLSSFFGVNKLNHISSATSEPGVYQTERLFIDIGYRDTLKHDLYTIEANITCNHIDDEFFSIDYQNIFGNDLIFEVNNFFKVSDKSNFLLGGTAYLLNGEQRAGNGFSIEPYKKTWYNAYFQGDYLIANGLKTVLGGQVNKIPNVAASVVPRIALIGSLEKGWGFKALYGQAFRAPYPGETDIRLNTVYGDPNLKQEVIKTYEGQVFLNSKKGNASITIFDSILQDIITPIENANEFQSDLIYANVGTSNTVGVEVEWKYSISKSGYLVGSYSFQDTENAIEGVQPNSRLPQHMIKVGITQSIGNWNMAIFNSHYSRRFDTEEALDVSGDLRAFNWLSAKIICKILKKESKSQLLELYLEGRNLLDIEVYDPEILFGDYNSVRIKPGINVNGGVCLKLN